MKYKILTLSLLYLFTFLKTTTVYSEENLPEPVTWKNEVKQLLYDDTVRFMDGINLMNLETPYRAQDAAVVPITINFNKNQTPEDFVKSLTIIVHENPSPIVGKFEFSPKPLAQFSRECTNKNYNLKIHLLIFHSP